MKLDLILFLTFISLFTFVKLAEYKEENSSVTDPADFEEEENRASKRVRRENGEDSGKCCGLCGLSESEDKLSKLSCEHTYHPVCLNKYFENSHTEDSFECLTWGEKIKYHHAFIAVARTQGGFTCLRERFPHEFIAKVFNEAMKAKNYPFLKRLIRVKFPFEVCNVEKNHSALDIVARRGTPDLLKDFLDSGIKFNYGNQNLDCISFCSAISANNFENAEYLLTRGVNFNKIVVDERILMNNLIKYDKITAIKWLIDHKIDLSFKSNDRNCALHYAIGKGSDEVVEMLLKAGADVESLNELNRRPLFSACYLGRPGAVRLLLDHGARTDIFTVEGYNSFHYSIIPGNIEVAKLFISRNFSIEMKNGVQCYVLHRVVLEKQVEMVKFLLKNGASPYESFDDYTFDYVLRQFPEYKTLLCRDDSPIVTAILFNELKIVEAFLVAGVNANLRIFGSKYSLLHLACELHLAEMFHLLLKYGADAHCVNYSGQYPKAFKCFSHI